MCVCVCVCVRVRFVYVSRASVRGQMRGARVHRVRVCVQKSMCVVCVKWDAYI